MNEIIVAVGSRNPPKVCATQEVFGKVLGHPIRVIPLQVDSGVPDQPWDDDIAKGAMNRYEAARKQCPDADYYVGIEAGVRNHILPKHLTCIEIAYVGSKNVEDVTPGMTGGFAVPNEIEALMVFDAMPMSEAADAILGTTNLGMYEGLVGHITENQVRRQEYIALSVLFALSAHLKRYGVGNG